MSTRIARNARPRESNIREDLDERVRSYGGETRAVAWLGRIGAPDVLCLFPPSTLAWRQGTSGRSAFVETKQVKGKLAKLQAEEHELLRRSGCEVVVIWNRAQLDAWLPELPF
jgi:hypothetical protein